jgi:nucleoside-diphosphate-sugar epimerase
MKLFVTGASGFLGRYVVAEALRRGHSVRAVCRSKSAAAKLGWVGLANLELVHVDLRSRKGLVEAVRGVDCVVHLAAVKAGDLYVQMAGTVVATENLLWAMDQAGDVRHIVHCSTFSVYDCLRIPSRAALDEDSPIEEDGFDRDEYAQTKVIQERLVRDHATTHGWRVCVLRPGVIWGRDNLWSSRLGFQPSEKLWIRTGAWGQYPQTYVENCAEAFVLACENRNADGQTLNLIDDEVPTQRAMTNALRRHATPRPFVLPINYSLLRFIAWSAWTFNRVALKRRAKIPGLFVPARLHARLKPLTYSNKRAKDVLGWTPRYTIEQGIERSLAPDAGVPASAGHVSSATAPRPAEAGTPGSSVVAHGAPA